MTDSVDGQGADGSGSADQERPRQPSFTPSNTPTDPRSTPTQGPPLFPDTEPPPTELPPTQAPTLFPPREAPSAEPPTQGPTFFPHREPPSTEPPPTQGPTFFPHREAPSTEPPPTQGPTFSPYSGAPSTHPVTEAAPPQSTDEVIWDRSATASGKPWPGSFDPGSGQPDSGQPGSAGLHRHGPGVPESVPGGQGVLTAEEVWRTGLPSGQQSRHGRGRWRRRAGSALTVALLIAVGVVVYLRLHHPPLKVTGVAITSQLKDGCTVDVTGRISTTGGAGTVSYEWVLTPPSGQAAPNPQNQSLTAGQSTLYVNVAIQGVGQLSRQVTLQVLGPGQGKATANVVSDC